jgi:hypothetical protein
MSPEYNGKNRDANLASLVFPFDFNAKERPQREAGASFTECIMLDGPGPRARLKRRAAVLSGSEVQFLPQFFQLHSIRV